MENNKPEFAKPKLNNFGRSIPPDNFEENEIQAKHKDLISDARSDRKILVTKIDLAERQEEKCECKNDKQSTKFIGIEKYAVKQDLKKAGTNDH